MIRKFRADDIEAIQQMNKDEGWDNLVMRHEQTLNSWMNSKSYVVEEDGDVIACIRAITDEYVTLYVCELIVRRDKRGQGIGQQLLSVVHDIYPTTRMELLATSQSKSFYESWFRPFYGFRRTYQEGE